VAELTNRPETGDEILDSGRWPVAIDFDGVLCDASAGWRGEHYFGEPIPEGVRLLKELNARGHGVVVYTARLCRWSYGFERKRDEAEICMIRGSIINWLQNNGLLQYVAGIRGEDKGFAFIIDDRAAQFTGGNADAILGQLDHYKPWWQVKGAEGDS